MLRLSSVLGIVRITSWSQSPRYYASHPGAGRREFQQEKLEGEPWAGGRKPGDISSLDTALIYIPGGTAILGALPQVGNRTGVKTQADAGGALEAPLQPPVLLLRSGSGQCPQTHWLGPAPGACPASGLRCWPRKPTHHSLRAKAERRRLVWPKVSP